MIVIALVIAWLFGLVLASMLAQPITLWQDGGMVLAGVVAVIVGRGWRREVSIMGGCLIAAALALLRYTIALPTIDETALSYYNHVDTFAIVRGTIISPPEQRERDLRFRLSASGVWIATEKRWQPVQGDAQVVVVTKSPLGYGDIIELHGKLIVPPEFGNSDSYRQYLARQGIRSYLAYPSLTPIGHDDSPLASFYAALYGARTNAAVAINNVLPKSEAGLLIGILLGDRSGLDSDLVQDFATSGTAQIVAISGQNISYVAAFILLIGRRLHLRPRYIIALSLVTIVVYTLFVGASAPVVRAAIMGSLYAIGAYFGRDYDVGISLAVAAWLMTLQNPSALWDVGLQLSFVALLGLVYLAPTLARALHRLPLLGEALVIALAAQLAVEPLILLYFNQVSLISPIANIVVEPALPLIMLAGAVGVPLLLLWRPLGLLPLGIAYVFLAFMVLAVHWFATLPFAALHFPPINGWWLLPYYLLLGAIVVAVEGRSTQREQANETGAAA